ncbi:MAG: hypothetical protein EPO16_11540 [Dehalococcoidia bacterium]|nr:MAG: hypothetical protein EPO16_11540 [Dehalococcoidia bacterium]
MGVGVSLVLIALGAVFTFAVSATMSGINLSTLGIILMTVGSIGLVTALLFWESYAPFSSWRARRVGVERVAVDIDPR